jgi:ketosteroid isomerase-like protein
MEGWVIALLRELSAVRFGASSFTVSDAQVTERTRFTAVFTDGTEQSGNSEAVWRRGSDGNWKVIRLSVS